MGASEGNGYRDVMYAWLLTYFAKTASRVTISGHSAGVRDRHQQHQYRGGKHAIGRHKVGNNVLQLRELAQLVLRGVGVL